MSKTNMRRVNVFKSDITGTYVQGKGYPMVTDYCGYFQGWGVELHEQEEGSTNFTIAIVERDDGSIDMVYPKHIQFVPDVQESIFPFKSRLMRLDLVEACDGLDKDNLHTLLSLQLAGLEVEVLCEAADDYYDIKLPNGRIIGALASYHLQALVR